MKKLEKSVLADGEVTGHAHRLPSDVDVFESDENTRQFSNVETVPLTHEEHGTILLPPNEYESGKVLEFDPLEKEVREVQD